MANKNNLASAHKLKDEMRAFNRAVVYSHLIDAPCFAAELGRRMNLTAHTITEYCKQLEEQGYARSEMVIDGMARFKLYHKTDKENYPWPAKCKKSTNIKREYFDDSYPGIHQALRDAIWEGRINPDIIKTHKEADADHWVIPKKDGSQYRGNFQSSLSGEYSA